LLRHLEQAGYRGAPRVFGIDAQNREILSWVPGRIVGERVLDDRDLARVARLVRDYHTAVATFMPSPDAVWHPDGRDPSGVHELICHTDLGWWNLVAGTSDWVFIDWDRAAPGRRLWDLALTVCTFLPMWPGVPTNIDRFNLFCDAYGVITDQRGELLQITVERTRRIHEMLIEKADHEPYAGLIALGFSDFWHGVSQHVASMWIPTFMHEC
jgi:hypothetical protein